MQQTWIVVSLVQVLEYAAEDLGLLVGELDALAVCAGEECTLDCRFEERRDAEYVLMCGEEPSFPSDLECDDRGGQSSACCQPPVSDR